MIFSARDPKGVLGRVAPTRCARFKIQRVVDGGGTRTRRLRPPFLFTGDGRGAFYRFAWCTRDRCLHAVSSFDGFFFLAALAAFLAAFSRAFLPSLIASTVSSNARFSIAFSMSRFFAFHLPRAQW